MRLVFPLVFLVGLIVWPASIMAESETEIRAQLNELQRERQKLRALREELETSLGQLGHELKALDKQLVEATKASLMAEKAVKAASRKLATLQKRHRRLESRVRELRERILNEASIAYQRLERTHWFVLALRGISVTEIPHRQYLLARFMESQADDRDRYVQVMRDLQRNEVEANSQLAELEKLQDAALARRKELAGRRQAKQVLWKRMQEDVRHNEEREQALVSQEKALKALLEQLHTGLLSRDRDIHMYPIRSRKGKLRWPIRGRIKVRFGKRSGPGKLRYAGVQLAPIGKNRQVKTVASGQVRYADWFGGYGLMMIIDHGDGMISVYAHNDALFKQVGDWVEEGEVIALAGSTGWVERTLLYFELRDNGKPVNPVKWCRRR